MTKREHTQRVCVTKSEKKNIKHTERAREQERERSTEELREDRDL